MSESALVALATLLVEAWWQYHGEVAHAGKLLTLIPGKEDCRYQPILRDLVSEDKTHPPKLKLHAAEKLVAQEKTRPNSSIML
eukprot:6133935-Amphidinium_carterae.1